MQTPPAKAIKIATLGSAVVGDHTKVVVNELDLRQSEGVVEGHEDGWLHQNVDHVHGSMPKEEGGCVKPCRVHMWSM